ncbi:MAG: hypothetical protein ACPF8V_07640 [Luteibaculum sp.]
MEEKKLNLILNIVKLGISAVGIILFLMILFGDGASTVGAALTLTYVALFLCALVALGFGIYLFISNMKHSKKGLISLVAFIAILLVTYAVASSEIPDIKQSVTASTVKMVGGGLSAFYVLLVGAVGAIVYAEVSKLLK